MTNLKTLKVDFKSFYRYVIIAVLFWTVIIAASLIWNYILEHRQIEKLARKETRTIFNKDIAYRHWATIHGGVYVPVTAETLPNPYLAHIAERDIFTPSGKKLTLMNPAYMLKQVIENYSELYNIRGHITSLNPTNPDNAPDMWERRALENFESGVGEVSEIIPSAEGDRMQLMRPFVTQEGCLKCHAHQGYKVGDVRGGVTISVDMEIYYNLMRSDIRLMAVTHGLIWLLGIVAAGFITHRAKRRLFERKQAEEELRKYESIIAATSDQMSFLDRNYVYRAVNSAHLKSHKRTRREIIGHSVSELIGEDLSGPLIKEKLDRCLAGEEIHYHVWFNFAGSGRRYMEMAYYPFRDIDESVSGIIVSGHDITERKRKEDELHRHREHLEKLVEERTGELAQSLDEMMRQRISIQNMALDLEDTNKRLVGEIKERKQAEKELKMSENRLRSTLTSMDDYVFVFDTESRFIDFFSTSKELLNPPEEFMGQRLSEVMPSYIDKLFAKAFDKNKAGRVADFEYQLETGGGLFSYSVKLSPMFVDDEFSGSVAVVRDITESKRASDNLQKAKNAAEAANRAKSAFLSNMSHELRTPLNAILGFAKVMDRCQEIPPGEKEHLAIICRSGEHLLNLINDVLDMAKIDSGRTVLSEKDFDLYRLLDDVENMFRLKTEEKELELVFEHDAGVPRYVRTDAGKLRQALMNLLGNAIKFTKKGGISVKTEYEEEEKHNLRFSVTDTGEGIAPDELDCLFDAFAQTETGRKSGEGTGLGLPISRKFVQMMGGDITVESEVGKGSVFRFRIQVKAVQGALIETAQPMRRVIALEPDQPCYRILIADDRESNRLLLFNILAPTGFDLRKAENGKEAMEIWEKWEPHLILMDMQMPVMDGYEATKKIKDTPNGRAAVIIAVTASAFEESRAAALSAGCDDFVHKPFKASQIFDVMAKHLGVRFIYENPTQAEMTEAPDQERDNALTTDALAALPADWVAALEQAILNIDLDMTADLIEQIRARDTLLADTLQGYVDDFEYERILTLIREAASQEGRGRS
jgi:PAS domain S-box-containing protein